MPTYVKAACWETQAARRWWGPLRISTVYIGGGTPSLLPLDLLAELVRVVAATFDLSKCTEISVEVNPGTVTDAYLFGLRSVGVDRLSIGVQSAQDGELQMLGRIHRWSGAVDAVNAARRAGFGNLSLDLLFGLPDQSVDRWRDTLKKALALEPEHLSLYGLSVEEGTPLAERIARGQLPAPDEDRAASMYELAEAMLAREGFFHYEISNWARIGGTSRFTGCLWWPEGDGARATSERSEEISTSVCHHNLTYWRNEPWLGIGAGAHSWMADDLWRRERISRREPARGRRWANVHHPQQYAEAAGRRGNPEGLRRDVERIGRRLEMGETMMLGLRLAEGVGAERFEARFGVALTDVFGEELSDLRRLGLLRWDGTAARLTPRGRLLGNRVFERFI